MIKVSLLITNYNYGKYLRRCIRSCLNQSMLDSFYEIIIVDDCSTDNSHNILRSFSDKENIKIIYNSVNVGLGSSCKLGSEKAMGQYIVRVDADDYVHEDFLKCLYLYASTNKAAAVSCDYYEVDHLENIISKKSAKDAPIACGVMFKTDILHEVGSYGDLRINEERDLLKRFQKKYVMEHLAIPLYRYYIHEESLSNDQRSAEVQ